MKLRLLIVLVALLCVGAWIIGRAYQRAQRPIPKLALPLPPPSPTPMVSVEFGRTLLNDLARISFVDLYETLSAARPEMREAWLRQIEDSPEGPQKVSALCAFFRALVQIDPKEAGNLVVNVPRHRAPAMDALLSAAPPSSMPQLVEMMLKLPQDARNYALTDHLGILIDEWAQIDPQAVARFLDKHDQLSNGEYGSALVEKWAGIDPVESRKWLEAHQDDVVEGVQSWLRGWFSADPQAAISYGLAHADDSSIAGALPSLAYDVFERDSAKARRFVEQLPSLKMRQDALETIARPSSWPDLEGNESPSHMATFVIQFPAEIWPREFDKVLEEWRQMDATGLLGWVSSLSPENQKAVIDNFPAPDSEAPESSFTPVLQLPASAIRTQLLQRLVKSLESSDRPIAETIASLKLPPEQKAEIAGLIPSKD